MLFGIPSADTRQWLVGFDDTKNILAAALEAGINFIDTSNNYYHGTSEAFIGRVLKELGIPRDNMVLASKVFFNEGGAPRSAILREIDGTLSRLGTDYLDLYILHRFDYRTHESVNVLPRPTA